MRSRFWVAFSYKGCGMCPSCFPRRVAATATYLVEHVFPELPVGQWSVPFPKRLRYSNSNTLCEI
jgi:hypothetical protein